MPTQAEILDEIKSRVQSGAITREKAIELVERAQQYGQETEKTPAVEAAPEPAKKPNFPTGADSPISRAIKNFVPNVPKAAYNLIPGIVDTTDPLTGERHSGALSMLGDMGKLGIGLANKVLPQGMQIPGQSESERAVDDLVAHVAPADPGAAWEDFAQHPAERAAEAAMLASGGKSLLKGAAGRVKPVLAPMRRGAAAALDKTASGLASSAIKPSKARGKLKKATTAVDEFLAQPDAEVSRGYLDELGKLIETVDSEKAAFFTELKKSGKPINTVPVAKVFGPIDKAIAEAGPEGKAGFVRARGNLESLLTDYVTIGPDGKPVVPADVVQDAKMRLSSDLRTTAYGTEKGPLTEGIKATVRGAKDAVAESYPEFQAINTREARLLTLQEALAPAVGRAESRNPIGLGTYGAAGAAGIAGALTGGPAGIPAAIGGGFLAHQLENPVALGRNAKRIKALANKVRPQAPQVPVAAPATALPNGTLAPIDAPIPPPEPPQVAPAPKTRKLVRKNPILERAEADAARRASEGVPVEGVAGSAAGTGKRLVRSRDEAGTSGQGSGGVGRGVSGKERDASGGGGVAERITVPNRNAVPGSNKLAWQTTQADYLSALKSTAPKIAKAQHEDLVRMAVKHGEAVPPEVLADYPGLAPKKPLLKSKARK